MTDGKERHLCARCGSATAMVGFDFVAHKGHRKEKVTFYEHSEAAALRNAKAWARRWGYVIVKPARDAA